MFLPWRFLRIVLLLICGISGVMLALIAASRSGNPTLCAIVNDPTEPTSQTFVDVQRGLLLEKKVQATASKYTVYDNNYVGKYAVVRTTNSNPSTSEVLLTQWERDDQGRPIQVSPQTLALLTTSYGDASEWQKSRLIWTNDKQKLLLIWPGPNGTYSLSSFDADGRKLDSAALTGVERPRIKAGLGFRALAKDNRFVTLLDNYDPVVSGLTHRIYSTDTLQPVAANLAFKEGAWSPDGHRYAGVTLSEGSTRLTLWDDSVLATVPLVSENGKEYKAVWWSPDGRYFTLVSTQTCQKEEACISRRYSFDIFDRDGNVHARELIGRDVGSTEPQGVFRQGTWTSDSSRFIFLQGRKLEKVGFVFDAISYDVNTSSTHSVITGLDAITIDSFFVLTPFYFFSPEDINLSLLPKIAKAIAVQQHNGQIHVEIIDLNTNQRSVIVDALGVLLPQGGYIRDTLLSITQDQVVFPWTKVAADGTQQNVLTWANLDGSGVGQTLAPDGEMKRIMQLAQPSPEIPHTVLGFIFKRGEQYSFGIVDQATGQVFPSVQNLNMDAVDWYSTVSAANSHIVISVGGRISNQPQQYLFRVDLKTMTATQLGANVNSWWIGEGNQLAFTSQRTANTPASLNVVSNMNSPMVVYSAKSSTNSLQMNYFGSCVNLLDN